MDAMFKKLQITPAKYGKEGGIEKQEFATFSSIDEVWVVDSAADIIYRLSTSGVALGTYSLLRRQGRVTAKERRILTDGRYV